MVECAREIEEEERGAENRESDHVSGCSPERREGHEEREASDGKECSDEVCEATHWLIGVRGRKHTGGPCRIRTGDLRVANAALYQLS